jgi:uncharacterized protein YdaU (DUF1376 family)
MAKDPAFLFYPNDYLGGTMGMTFEEKGAYMELLMMQFNRGHMTTHMIGQTIGQLFGRIEDKFKVDADGLYYNQRLDNEIQKRQNFVASRVNNKSGKNQYTGNRGHMTSHMTSHMIGHMENVNENINKDDIPVKEKGSRGKPFCKPTLEEVNEYCNERKNSISGQEFIDHYESNGWKVGQNKMSDWKAAVRTWERRAGQFGSSKKQTDYDRIMAIGETK